MKTNLARILATWLRAPVNVVLHLLYVKLDYLARALTHEIRDHELFLIHPRTPAPWTPSSTRRNLVHVEPRPMSQADHHLILPRVSVEMRSLEIGARLPTRAPGRLTCLTGLASTSRRAFAT